VLTQLPITFSYDNDTPQGNHFRGNVDLLTQFQSINFRLDSPPKWLHAKTHWRRSAAAFIMTTRATVTQRRVSNISINIGSLDFRVESTRLLLQFAVDNFGTSWKFVREYLDVNSDVYESNISAPWEPAAFDDEGHPGASADVPRKTFGQRLKARYSSKQLEAYSRCALIEWVGSTAHDMKADLWLENSNRRMLLHVETPLDLLKYATWGGFCDGDDVWLKVGKYRRYAWTALDECNAECYI